VALLLPRNNQKLLSRAYGIAVALATFLQSLFVLAAFEPGQAGFQLETNWAWVPALGIRFHLGVDGISLWLVLLSTLMVLVTLLSPQATGFVRDRNRGFMAAMLMLESGMIGAFLALDMFAFYVFWELMLVPMYFIIGIWGGERRVYAAIKFMIFTLVGSLLMLAAILVMAATVHKLDRPVDLRLHHLVEIALAARHAAACVSAPSRSPSSSRCRSFRCTPGCPTPTSRHPPAAR
jgi:NADH-quinone oxidoreductase subunit M